MTKGEALAAVCGKLNIKLEETIAFGDQELDIPMLKKAGVGVAMGNAIEEVKEAADFVTNPTMMQELHTLWKHICNRLR